MERSWAMYKGGVQCAWVRDEGEERSRSKVIPVSEGV